MNIPNRSGFSQEAGSKILQLCSSFLPAISIRVVARSNVALIPGLKQNSATLLFFFTSHFDPRRCKEQRRSHSWFEAKFCNFALLFYQPFRSASLQGATSLSFLV
jgi:hypothetical protein